MQQLRKDLRQAKVAHAEAALDWFSTRVEMNVARMRDKGEPVEGFRVTVRFAEYKDLDLAREIEAIVKKCTNWPIEIDGSNKPTIMPNKDFKVVFDVGPWEWFNEVVWAFDYGELVEGKIGKRVTERFGDKEHLIIDVLPTITQ